MTRIDCIPSLNRYHGFIYSASNIPSPWPANSAHRLEATGPGEVPTTQMLRGTICMSSGQTRANIPVVVLVNSNGGASFPGTVSMYLIFNSAA
jgi:hypothetical protein